MKLRQIKNRLFDGSTKKLAEAMGSSESAVRTFICLDRRAIELANGNYVLVNSHTKIISVPESEVNDA